MSPWDYIAMVTVWYLLAARVAVGNHFHMSVTSTLLWPLFFGSLIPHAALRAQLLRTVVSVLALALITFAAYSLVAYFFTNVLIRFVLAFPVTSLGTLVLFALGALVYGVAAPTPRRRDVR